MGRDDRAGARLERYAVAFLLAGYLLLTAGTVVNIELNLLLHGRWLEKIGGIPLGATAEQVEARLGVPDARLVGPRVATAGVRMAAEETHSISVFWTFDCPAFVGFDEAGHLTEAWLELAGGIPVRLRNRAVSPAPGASLPCAPRYASTVPILVGGLVPGIAVVVNAMGRGTLGIFLVLSSTGYILGHWGCVWCGTSARGLQWALGTRWMFAATGGYFLALGLWPSTAAGHLVSLLTGLVFALLSAAFVRGGVSSKCG